MLFFTTLRIDFSSYFTHNTKHVTKYNSIFFSTIILDNYDQCVNKR